MVTHNVTINLAGASAVAVTAELIVVKRSNELAPALRQRGKPIVIENKEVELKFRRYLFLERLSRLILIGWLAHSLSGIVLKAIEKEYQVQGTIWHEWKIDKSGGTITLTPKNIPEKRNSQPDPLPPPA